MPLRKGKTKAIKNYNIRSALRRRDTLKNKL